MSVSDRPAASSSSPPAGATAPSTEGAPSAESRTLVAGEDTFPAGSAVAVASVWFLLKRIAVRATTQSSLNTIASAAGSAAAVLGSIAVLLTLSRAALAAEGTTARIAGWLRVLFALPVALLVFVSLHTDAPPWLQWCALAGAAGTIAGSLGRAALAQGVSSLARATLALLCVGQLIELVVPVAQAGVLVDASARNGSVRTFGAVAELCALAGSVLAAVWAVRSTARVAGTARVRLFAPMPIFVSLVLLTMSATLQPRLVSYVALGAFGARFDLLRMLGVEGTIPRGFLLVYLTAPLALLAAAVLSVGGVLSDRGASTRRVLGWSAVLMAGFGALRLAGPVDPLRVLLVVFGCVLVAEAAELEGQSAVRPAPREPAQS